MTADDRKELLALLDTVDNVGNVLAEQMSNIARVLDLAAIAIAAMRARLQQDDTLRADGS